MHCKLIGGDFKYTLGPATKPSRGAPCTNVPTLCPTCPAPTRRNKGVYHWKLNMLDHYKLAHRGVDPPTTLQKQLEITQQERDWVKIVGGDRKKVPT